MEYEVYQQGIYNSLQMYFGGMLWFAATRYILLQNNNMNTHMSQVYVYILFIILEQFYLLTIIKSVILKIQYGYKINGSSYQ